MLQRLPHGSQSRSHTGGDTARHITPDSELIALIKQGMTDKQIATHCKVICGHSFKGRLNRIKRAIRDAERQRHYPVTVKHMEQDEIIAKYGYRGEHATKPPGVVIDVDGMPWR